MLKLIRAFLNAGVMERGPVSPTTEGTPQGGPLSPFLSNVVLDELDRELERRGHRFVRYADDCNIYVRSERGGATGDGEHHRLHHQETQAEGEPGEKRGGQAREAEVPGIQLYEPAESQGVRVAPAALARCRERLRGPDAADANGGTGRRWSRNCLNTSGDGRATTATAKPHRCFRDLDSWIRRRLRRVAWKQWKRGRKRYAELRTRGVRKELAAHTAGSTHGPWRISRSPALSYALPNAFFDALELPRLAST